jgi:hypothetical protein
MSHNASPTVNVTNINIYNDSVNSGLNTLGLSPVTPGQTVPEMTQQALAQMETALKAKFNAAFSGNPLPPSNTDGGYMGPLSSVVPGQAPTCAVQQITSDFTNWGLSSSGLPTTIASQVTQEIVSQGGGAGFSSGTLQVTSSENLYWMVGYLTINITQTETGILYVFAASEGIFIP